MRLNHCLACISWWILGWIRLFSFADNLLTKVKEVMSDVDLSCIIPVRKQLSMLNTVNIVFQKLSHVLDSYLPTLFHIIVILLAQCAAILQRREEVHPRCINGLKSLRQNAMQRLIQVMTHLHFRRRIWVRTQLVLLCCTEIGSRDPSLESA